MNRNEIYGTADQRAARGATLLDGTDPRWFNNVDVRILNMGDRCNCVLGQTRDTYGKGLTELLGRSARSAFSDVMYGFDYFDDDNVERETLKTAWIKQILARREKDKETANAVATASDA